MFRAIRGLHSWPSSTHPTPYEIFGMTPQSFNKKKLKTIYLELAKTYHPDRCDHLKDCQSRFKMIGEAYTILRNDSKRDAWNTSHSIFSPNVGGTKYPTQYYSRPDANWRDPYDPDLNTQASEAKFKASLQESRWFFLKVVVSTMILVGVMEITALFKASDKRVEHLENLSEEASMAHSLAFNNYHKGSSAQERIDRFLAQREYTLTTAPSNFRYSQISSRD